MNLISLVTVVVSCVWADMIRWRGISWDIMRGIWWEEGEGRNNGVIGKLCARFCFKKGGGRQESGKGGGIGGGRRGLPCCPSLQMSPNVNFPTLPSICIKRWQANLSTRKFIFYFNCAFTSNINIVWHPKGWATGKASYSSRQLPKPPPPFIHTALFHSKITPLRVSQNQPSKLF